MNAPECSNFRYSAFTCRYLNDSIGVEQLGQFVIDVLSDVISRMRERLVTNPCPRLPPTAHITHYGRQCAIPGCNFKG